MSNGPEEASADMRVAARALRDMYVALVAEGFSEQQALQMVGVTISTMLSNGSSS